MIGAAGFLLLACLIAHKSIRIAMSRNGINVLLITLDTTRADYLGCYGYRDLVTPNLDQLAAESVVFDQAIAQAAVTPVSHASILTGLNPYHHGLRVLHGLVANRLAEQHVTLADLWKLRGGHTAAFVSAFPVTERFGLSQGFEHFDASFLSKHQGSAVSQDGTVNTGLSQRRADETTLAAVSWLDYHRHTSTPIFMWVHYFDPHDPYLIPPKSVVERFRPESDNRDDVLRAIYASEVFFMDHHLGILLRAFRDHGLWDDTAVIVVADHGEGLGDHDWWSHGILYQEQIRVPLIIHLPGMTHGKRVQSLVRTIDLFPTILEAAKIPISEWPPVDGTSLLDLIQVEDKSEHRIAYSGSVNMLSYARIDSPGTFERKDDKLYALFDGSHKLIYHQLEPDESEFYNLISDPAELIDLSGDSLPEMTALINHLTSLNAFSDIMPGMTSSEFENVRRLRELGYVE
jgi:arylsulfatase A-like enzyme